MHALLAELRIVSFGAGFWLILTPKSGNPYDCYQCFPFERPG